MTKNSITDTFSDRRMVTSLILLLIVLLFVFFILAQYGPVQAQSESDTYVPSTRINAYRCLELGDFSGINSSITVESGSLVFLHVAWGMADAKYSDDFLVNTTRHVEINDFPIYNESTYWADEAVPNDLGWQNGDIVVDSILYWSYPPIGPLPDGESISVRWGYVVDKKFSDGYYTIYTDFNPDNTCTITWGS